MFLHFCADSTCLLYAGVDLGYLTSGFGKPDVIYSDGRAGLDYEP